MAIQQQKRKWWEGGGGRRKQRERQQKGWLGAAKGKAAMQLREICKRKIGDQRVRVRAGWVQGDGKGGFTCSGRSGPELLTVAEYAPHGAALLTRLQITEIKFVSRARCTALPSSD